jgi:hypothetical protein
MLELTTGYTLDHVCARVNNTRQNQARYLLWCAVYVACDVSLAELGRRSQRARSTIAHGLAEAQRLMTCNPVFRQRVRSIVRSVRATQ